MKRNIIDFLDIDMENLDLAGGTPLSPTRIKELTMNKIKNQNTPEKSRRFRAPVRVAAAVAVAAALSVSALAANGIFGAGLQFQDFFTQEGGTLSQGQLDAIDQMGYVFDESAANLPAAVTDNGATITPIAAIADENVCYIRLRVEAPEGTVLPDLDPDVQGYYQLGASLGTEEGAYTEFDYLVNKTDLADDDPADNRKEFVLTSTVMEGETDLRFNDGVPKTLTISGLWIQSPEKEYTAVFTGNFVFNFDLSIQSQTIDLDAQGLTWHHELLDYTNTVKSMTLSPLSLSCCIDSTLPVNDNIGSYVGDIEIVLKDGTVVFSMIEDYDKLQNYIQHRGNITLPLTGQPTGVFKNCIRFDQPLDLSQVDYVMYGDHKIPVNVE